MPLSHLSYSKYCTYVTNANENKIIILFYILSLMNEVSLYGVLKDR